MRRISWVWMRVLVILQCSALIAKSSSNFDFFYFVQAWLPSYCNTKEGCCYPSSGKPAEDFGIYGFFPAKNDASLPMNCSTNDLDIFQISDLKSRLEENWPGLYCPSDDGLSFWSREWKKHGSCANLDQHAYFKHALDLKDKLNILQALNNAGITPGDGKQYKVAKIEAAIKDETGYYPSLECNEDPLGNLLQVFQVYLCVDKSGLNLIQCPVFLDRYHCGLTTTFPSFSEKSVALAI